MLFRLPLLLGLPAVLQNFNHKTSTWIAKNHGIVVVEDLKIKNMSKSAKGTQENPGINVAAKSGLNRSILRQGWGQLGAFLQYKTVWNGGALVKVDPKRTSQTCSRCGEQDKAYRKTQARFVSSGCDFDCNADLNAAKNILTRGLRDSASRDAA